MVTNFKCSIHLSGECSLSTALFCYFTLLFLLKAAALPLHLSLIIIKWVLVFFSGRSSRQKLCVCVCAHMYMCVYVCMCVILSEALLILILKLGLGWFLLIILSSQFLPQCCKYSAVLQSTPFPMRKHNFTLYFLMLTSVILSEFLLFSSSCCSSA